MPEVAHGALRDAILRTRAGYNARGISDHAIGNGHCDDFAGDVMEAVLGERWRHLEGEGCQTVETGNFCRWRDDMPNGWDPKVLKAFGIARPAGATAKAMREVGLDCPNHVWIVAGGRHYDAESPDGEASFLDLKFFRRHLGLLRPEDDAAYQKEHIA